jgi:ABC-type spermidine/putrescine transport system permease subunit I
MLLGVLGERVFRTISPFLQGLLIALLLTVLLLFPVVSRYLAALLTSGETAVRYFPPFWFLGVYESLLHGAATQPVFTGLARTGCVATVVAVAAAVLAYPLA